MKKITLLAAALMLGATSFAQVIIERPADGGNSIISTEGNDGTGVYCADYFSLAEDTELGSLIAIGTNSNGGSIADLTEGWNVFVYADAAGSPAGDPTGAGSAAVLELSDIPASLYDLTEDGAGASEFAINFAEVNDGEAVTLAAGNYWLVCFPNVASAPGDAGRWNWGLSTAMPDNLNQLIDPADLFQAGATSWTQLDGLVAGSTAFAWTLNDPTVLGAEENLIAGVSVYPNPATDVLNVKVPASVELYGATLYDVLGKATNVSLIDGQANIASLSRGMYILNVSTSAGTLTEKVIIE